MKTFILFLTLIINTGHGVASKFEVIKDIPSLKQCKLLGDEFIKYNKEITASHWIDIIPAAHCVPQN